MSGPGHFSSSGRLRDSDPFRYLEYEATGIATRGERLCVVLSPLSSTLVIEGHLSHLFTAHWPN